MKKSAILAIALSLLVAAAHAQTTTKLIDYQGFAWETGGVPPSNAGDILSVAAITTSLDEVFGIDVGVEELTIWATDLMSTGQIDFGGGFLGMNYVGGTIELWQDASQNATFGINPPNATVASTFTDGSLFLQGIFTSFFLFFDTTFGIGSYEGFITWTGGSALATIMGLEVEAFTFGGVLDSNASGGNVPEGYDLQTDGVIEAKVTVAVEETSWGAVKELFRH